MKVKVSLAILLFCLGVADSLQCWKCLTPEGNCTETDKEICSPNQDSCFFEIRWFTGMSASTVKQGCGTSNNCRHYREGNTGLLFQRIYCCSSDLCKPVNYPDSRNGSKNGVTCQNCIGSAAECGRNAPSAPCYGSMDRCVQISQRFLLGEELAPIIKGCGNSSFTDMVVAYQIGKDFAYIDQKSCSQSNCNNGSFTDIPSGPPNGLKCYTCQDSGHGECARDRLQTLNCTGIMDRCVKVVNNELPVTIQKGCATESMCTRNLPVDMSRLLMRQNSRANCCKTSFCNRAGIPSAPEMLLMVTALALWLALMAWK